MEMTNILKMIGSLVLASITVAIPILCGLSFGLNWNVFYKFLLTAITLGFVGIQTVLIYTESEE